MILFLLMFKLYYIMLGFWETIGLNGASILSEIHDWISFIAIVVIK